MIAWCGVHKRIVSTVIDVKPRKQQVQSLASLPPAASSTANFIRSNYCELWPRVLERQSPDGHQEERRNKVRRKEDKADSFPSYRHGVFFSSPFRRFLFGKNRPRSVPSNGDVGNSVAERIRNWPQDLARLLDPHGVVGRTFFEAGAAGIQNGPDRPRPEGGCEEQGRGMTWMAAGEEGRGIWEYLGYERRACLPDTCNAAEISGCYHHSRRHTTRA